MSGTTPAPTGFERFRPRGPAASWAWTMLVLMPMLLGISAYCGTLVPEQWIAAIVLTGLAWAGPKMRELSIVATLFTSIGVGYRFLAPLMKHRLGLHIGDLWALEHSLFDLGNGVALSDWIAAHTHPAADFVAGIAYITYLVETFLVATWLFFRGSANKSLQLAVAFVLVNLVGWATWFFWPAAPPWYVDQYGVDAVVLNAPASAAGAARFDELIGFPLFHGFYSQSTNVFGAMPSLHSCYPVATAVFAWNHSKGLRAVTVIYALIMALSAVYLRHHYLLDVLFGMALGLVGALSVQKVFEARHSSRVTSERENVSFDEAGVLS